jgi:hypothetical protein
MKFFLSYLIQIINSFFVQYKIVSLTSEIFKLGNLKNYSFEDLKNSLSNTKVEIVKRDTDFFLAKFSEDSTELLICFATNGKFKHIEYEYWKDLDVKFQNNKIIFNI